MRKDLERLLEHKIEQAKEGREIWQNLSEKYNAKNRKIILLPHEEEIYRQSIEQILPKYLQMAYVDKVVLLYVGNNWEAFMDDNRVVLENITKEQEMCLEIYYSMYEFTTDLLIASLDKPSGRKGKNLVDNGRFSLTEALQTIVFGIYD